MLSPQRLGHPVLTWTLCHCAFPRSCVPHIPVRCLPVALPFLSRYPSPPALSCSLNTPLPSIFHFSPPPCWLPTCHNAPHAVICVRNWRRTVSPQTLTRRPAGTACLAGHRQRLTAAYHSNHHKQQQQMLSSQTSLQSTQAAMAAATMAMAAMLKPRSSCCRERPQARRQQLPPPAPQLPHPAVRCWRGPPSRPVALG